MIAGLDLGRAGAWCDRAACKGRTSLFFAEDPFSQRVALAVCRGCAVRAECLADVLATEARGVRYGVVAGLTAAQRRALR